MVALVLIATPVTATAQNRLPIAYVSMQRVLAEADAAKAATKELEALRAEKTKELSDKKQALDATRLQIANAGGYFSAGRRAELVELAKRQEAELQQATQQSQVEFQEHGRKLQDQLRGEINAIVLNMAKLRGFQYVLNQDTAVLLAPPGVDLTADVLAQLKTNAAQREATAKAGAEADKK